MNCKDCGDTGTIFTGNKALPFIDCGCTKQPEIISLADYRLRDGRRRKGKAA